MCALVEVKSDRPDFSAPFRPSSYPNIVYTSRLISSGASLGSVRWRLRAVLAVRGLSELVIAYSMPNASRKGRLLSAGVIRTYLGLRSFRRAFHTMKEYFRWPAVPVHRPASIRILRLLDDWHTIISYGAYFGDTSGRAPWKILVGSMSKGSASVHQLMVLC